MYLASLRQAMRGKRGQPQFMPLADVPAARCKSLGELTAVCRKNTPER